MQTTAVTSEATVNALRNPNLTVAPATTELLSEIVTLLGDFNNSRITPENWQRFLTYLWRDPNVPFGYVLKDGAKIVGFIATIHSPPLSFTSKEHLCHISSWILKEEYRAKGIGFALIEELLKSSNCVFTNMSPSPGTIKGLKNLGWTELEHFQTVLTPLCYLSSFLKGTKISFCEKNEELRKYLKPTELKIFEDHLPYPCSHLSLQSKRGSCYLIFRVTNVGRYKVAEVHYLSDPDVFQASAGALSLWFLRRHGVPKVVVDSRMLKGRKIGLSLKRKINQKKLFLSKTVLAEEIPNFYSEVVMLP